MIHRRWTWHSGTQQPFARRRVGECLPGNAVEEVAGDLEMSAATLYRWKKSGADRRWSQARRQELRARRTGPGPQADQGPRSGARAGEGGQRAVQREGGGAPKRLGPVVRGLSDLGYSERTACRVVGMSRSTFRSRRPGIPPTGRCAGFSWPTRSPSSTSPPVPPMAIRRMRAALFYERGLIVNSKLIRRIMAERGLSGLPTRKKGRRNLVNVATSEDLVNRNFSAPVAEHAVADRHHRAQDPRGNPLLLRGARPVLPAGRRLGDRPAQRSDARERRPHHGARSTSDVARDHSAQRPRFAVHLVVVHPEPQAPPAARLDGNDR